MFARDAILSLGREDGMISILLPTRVFSKEASVASTTTNKLAFGFLNKSVLGKAARLVFAESGVVPMRWEISSAIDVSEMSLPLYCATLWRYNEASVFRF